MANSKATKKALFMSMLSLLLCFTMLMGATFAWFTDTVKSTNNIIKSGNLDIELYYQVEGQTDWTKVTESSNIFKENALWEPGYTEVVRLKAVNEGSLALKYQLGVNVVSEVTSVNVNGGELKLSEHIKYGLIDGDAKYTRETAIAAVDANATKLATAYTSDVISLYPAGYIGDNASASYPKEKIVTLVVYMPTTVDNVANHAKDAAVPTINLGLNVSATQLAAEMDSFDNTYDKDATYTDVVVTDAATLEAAIANGEKLIGLNGTITLTKSLGATGVTFVGTSKGAGIDFGTYGISGEGNIFKNLTLDNERDDWYKGMQYSDGENTTYINCTIANGVTTYGNSIFDGCTFAELPAGKYNLFIYDGKNIVVKNSTFKYGNRAIKIYNEGYCPEVSVSISNCTFLMSDTSVLNKALIEIDDTYMNSVKVDVKNITVDGALKAQGVYRIDDGELDTSTAKSVVTVDGVIHAISDGLSQDASGNYYVSNAAGLQSMKNFMDEKSNKEFWGKTYTLTADIDASGVTWNTKHLSPDSSYANGIIFDGKGYTISNLTINGQGLFTGATKGGNSNNVPVFKNITFDNVTVTGGTHHNGVVWGEAYGSITLENVNVINSTVNGGCNVGGLVGRNSESHATFTFKDCSVKNTTVNATKAADYAGASAFLGMALNIGTSTSANVVFEGNNVSEGNTLNTASGMQGGGIYTTATWGEATWEIPTVVNAFTNYNSNN